MVQQTAVEVVMAYVTQFKSEADAANAALAVAHGTIDSLSMALEETNEKIKTLSRLLEICRERADAAEEVIRTYVFPDLTNSGVQ